MTQTKTPEGGHSCPPKNGLEKLAAVTSKNNLNAFGSSPEDWTEKSLGDILTLNYGWSLPEKKRVPGDAPVYGSNGIVGTHQQALVASPGLIVGRKGSAGNVHYSREPFCPIDTTFYIAPSDTSLDIKFLYFLLLHIDLKRILGDVGVPGLNREMAYKEKARLPTGADEQRKIAGVLGLVQRAMEQQERLLTLTAELKKTLLHQLFTQGLRGEPQKQTEIGPVPESWEVVTLGDIFHTQLGKMLSQKAHGGQAPKLYLRNKNVQWGRIDVTDLLEMDFNERELAKHRLLPGDLLVCEGGEPGRAALWNGEISECYYQKALHRLRPKDERATNCFLAHWLMFSLKLQNLYGVAGASSTIAHLPEVQLKALPIPKPTRSEQDEICVILEGADKKLDVVEKKHAALTALFRTLLHQLMTAQIRVNDLDVEGILTQSVRENGDGLSLISAGA